MTLVDAPRIHRLSTDRPISIAILAMGGQGGGVLADWIVALAEAQGWAAQSTSVPGVAQRTGATIYYIEMLLERAGKRPIFALMPAPGDVDVVLAAEWMEAGRSIMRGLVTPDLTTVIASTHRSFAVQEKERPGNGIADSEAVIAAGDVAAKRIISFDMQTMAERNGTVISATLFGALAGAGVLPFPRNAYEAAIRAGGKGAEPSLRGFEAAFTRARLKPQDVTHVEPEAKTVPLVGERTGHPALDALLDRIERSLPEPTRILARAGVERLVDYQDVAYAGEYLDRLQPLLALDQQYGGSAKGFALTAQAAKYIAVAMSYDDVIRVADLKTRASRFDRVRREVAAKPDQLLYMTEFMHPRMEEVLGTLPRGIGSALAARPRARGLPGSLGQPRAARPHGNGPLVSRPVHGRGPRPVASWLAPPRARRRTRGALAERRHGRGSARLRPRGRGSGVSPSREGLFRHPRPWSFQVRSRAGRSAVPDGPRREFGLAAPAEGGRAQPTSKGRRSMGRYAPCAAPTYRARACGNRRNAFATRPQLGQIPTRETAAASRPVSPRSGSAP